jgi:hypothetical protein
MKNRRTVSEMTRLVSDIKDEFTGSAQGRVLAAIHDTLTWVIDTAVPNSRITDYFPDADN